MWQKAWLFGLLGGLLLLGCQAPSGTTASLPCDTMIPPELLAVDLDTLPESEIVAWISTNYGERRPITERDYYDRQMLERQVNANTTEVWENPNWDEERRQMLTEGIVVGGSSSAATYQWGHQGQIYRAAYHQEQQRLLSIDIEFDPQPTLADLDRCFGTPAYYEANFYTHTHEWVIPSLLSRPTHTTSFTLYYPAQGLSFFDYRDGDGHTKPDISMDTPVETASVLRSGTVVDLMNDGVPGFDHELSDVTPFPDQWTELEYEEIGK